MSVKAKTTIIIVLTLFIGVAIGAMLNRALLHRRIARTIAWGNPAAMTANLERLLSPTDEQSKEIRRILEEHGAVLLKIRKDSMQETMVVMQSLEAALDPILTPEQKRSLSRRDFGPRAFGKPGQGLPPGRRPERRGSEELERLAERLGLTPDQKNQIGSLLQQPVMASPFGWGSRDIEGMLLRWANRQEQLDRAISGILTEEQKQEYARIKQERRQKILDLLER
jgi:Spy/CpxP family protein refolding chaperone